MTRRLFGAAATLAFAAAAIVPGAALAQDKPTVLVWTDSVRQPGFVDFQNAVADRIDVTVEIQDISQMLGKIQLANQVGSGWPDIIFAEPSQLALFIDPSVDYALELNAENVGQDFLDGFGSSNVWCEVDGKTWCFKNDLAQSVLWYDTVIFDELGLTVPTTMDEFQETALSLEGTGYVAGAIGDQNFYASYLWPAGCPMGAPGGDATTIRINSQDPACTAVAELVQPMVDAGVLDRRSSFDAGFLADVAQQGNVAMTLGPSWFGDFVIRDPSPFAVPEGRIAAAPMPKWAHADEAWSGEWGGGIFVVSNKAPFPEAAIEAAKFMVSDPVHVEGEPTFPAYGPANVIWTERVGTEPYYVGNPAEAMTVQASLINPVVGPVRVDVYEQLGSALAQPITAGVPIQEAIDGYAQALKNLAPQFGYNVTD